MNKIVDFPIKSKGTESPERLLREVLTWKGIKNIALVMDVENVIYVLGSSEKNESVLGLLELGKFRILQDSLPSEEELINA